MQRARGTQQVESEDAEVELGILERERRAQTLVLSGHALEVGR